MNEEEKRKLITWAIIIGVVLTVLSGGVILIPIAILGLIYYFHKHKNDPVIVNSRMNEFVNTFDVERAKKKLS